MIPADLQQSPYISLGTYRRNGKVVDTPVWFADDGKALYVLSAGNAGKIKRLRNSSQARVASCTFNGGLLGCWYQGSASLLPQNAVAGIHKLFVRKYGWQMRVFDMGSRMGGRYHKRAYIRIELSPVQP